MKTINFLSSLVITMVAVVLACLLLLLLLIVFLQALVIESIRKMSQRSTLENVVQLSFDKETHSPNNNLLPNYQRGLEPL